MGLWYDPEPRRRDGPSGWVMALLLAGALVLAAILQEIIP